MPELPEVEVVVRGLRPFLEGQTIHGVWASGKAMRSFPGDSSLLTPILGQTIRLVRRRAKCILIGLDHHWLMLHLGMTGVVQCHERPRGAGPAGLHEHLCLTLDRQQWLSFEDPRRFGDIQLLPRRQDAMGQPEDTPDPELLGAASRGCEPLSAEFTPNHLHRAATGVRQAIKPWLMSGHVVVGVGNIYASEALFRAGISPKRAAGRVSADRMAALTTQIRAVLQAAIEAGGSTLRDYRNAQGEVGRYGSAHQVYGREGQPCPNCGTAIRRLVQAQRASFYCHACQR